MLSSEQLDVFIARNFAGKSVKPVTIEVARKHVTTLVQTYQKKIFSPNYVECIQEVVDSSLSTETKKARIVNWTRLIRSMTDDEFDDSFDNSLDRTEVLERMGDFIREINGGMAATKIEEAKEGVISEAYVPFTLIYDRAEAFVNNKAIRGEEVFILRCKLLARLMILDHPPRRNELLLLEFPPAPVGSPGRNVWDGGNHIHLNAYKTVRVHKEYIMKVTPEARLLLDRLYKLKSSKEETKVFPTGTILDYLSASVGFKLSCNQIRHAFLTYVYGGGHSVPIYPQEKEDIAKSMGHSISAIDRYIVRLKPYLQDKDDFYKCLVLQRHKKISAEDKEIIARYNEETSKVTDVGSKNTKRVQTPLITKVLKKYSSLFLDKTPEEKRKERPYLYLSQCTDPVEGTDKTVCEILGSDPELIKKWCSVQLRQSQKM